MNNYVLLYLYIMRIKLTSEQMLRFMTLLENEGSVANNDKFKKVYGDKGNDFNDGYEKGYIDGWLDAKSGSEYNDKFSWDKYVKKG